MSSILEWINGSLDKIEHKVFKDVVKAEDADSKPLDDGQIVMISDIKRINLTIITKGGEKKQLKVIAKVEANSDAARGMASNFDAFPTEIKMYGDVLKSMEKLMTEVEDEDHLWADCYHCGDNKFLFQDLCEDGYRVVPSHHFLDVDHTLVVMKGLGKFHSLSLVMKERNTLNKDSFLKPYYARKLSVMDVIQKQSLDHLSKTMKEKWGGEWSSIGDRLLKYLDKPGDIMYNAWESTMGKWDVLNHGDFTIRNMLFHYKQDSSKPDGIKFVDFQMCHYGNLANDLIQLLYTSVRPPLRENNMKLFLETYIKSLTSTTKLYGYQGPLPTIQDIESSIQALAPIILTNSIFSIPFFISSGKEDVQKKTDEYFEKFDSFEEIVNAQEQDQSKANYMADYEDPEVKEFLQFELNRFIKEKLF